MHDVHASAPLSLVKSARVKLHWRLSAKVAQSAPRAKVDFAWQLAQDSRTLHLDLL